MYFAVVQDGHGVYGVGQSEEEAIASARRLGSPEQIRAALVDAHTALHGDIVLAECTQKLFDRVKKNGVGEGFEYTEDGLVDIEYGCYRAEAGQYAC